MSPLPDSSPPIPENGQGLFTLQITHERGPMTRLLREAALAWGGEAAWGTLLASVSPACRVRFQDSLGFYEWVESPLALELHAAWARLRGLDDFSKRGEDAAREMLGTVQRWILRLASPTLLLQCVPRIFGYYYRGGRMSLAHLRSGTALLELRALGYPDSWFRDGLSTWMKVALELTGAREVTVNHVPPGEGLEHHLHRFEVAWKP